MGGRQCVASGSCASFLKWCIQLLQCAWLYITHSSSLRQPQIKEWFFAYEWITVHKAYEGAACFYMISERKRPNSRQNLYKISPMCFYGLILDLSLSPVFPPFEQRLPLLASYHYTQISDDILSTSICKYACLFLAHRVFWVAVLLVSGPCLPACLFPCVWERLRGFGGRGSRRSQGQAYGLSGSTFKMGHLMD